MSGVETRIRDLVERGGGRASVASVVTDGLRLPVTGQALARKLVAAAVAPIPGLVLEGDEVVARAAAPRAQRVVLALAPTKSRTALPAVAAWLPLPAAGEPVVVSLSGDGWREGAMTLARDLAGCEVFALSASSCRRVLRLGATLGDQDPEDEPSVVGLGALSRRLGSPLKSSEDAARLVGADLPASPQDAARLLVKVVDELARRAGADLAALRVLADAEVPEFDFGARSLTRADLLALPESPGIYVFEDVEGDVAYVGKAANLRRRVSSYFAAVVDERAGRVRDVAHALSVERTGSELTALLREQQLIRDLRPALNVQLGVHPRKRAVEELATRGPLAIVQPSAEGGAEIVLLHHGSGVHAIAVVPEAGAEACAASVRAALRRLGQPSEETRAGDVELALTWLADSGSAASLVDASGDPDEVARVLVRLASDQDLEAGRVIVVR